MLFILKAATSGLLVALVATVARRHPAFGAFIPALPLISVMGMIWLWQETHDAGNTEAHVAATFWYVIPSLPMFLPIPPLLRAGTPFYPALAAGCALTALLYAAVAWIASRFGTGL